MMIVSTSPHLSLLQLNDLESQVSSKLYKLCRSWVYKIIKNKAFSPPDFLPAPNVVDNFKYDKEWLEKNALSVYVDQEKYDALTRKVREFDLDEKHSGPKNDGTNQQESDQTNGSAMEAGKEKSTEIGEPKDTAMEAVNDTAREAGKEKSTEIGETQDTTMEAANDTAMDAGEEKSTESGELKDTTMEAANDTVMEAGQEKSTEIGETQDTTKEAANDTVMHAGEEMSTVLGEPKDTTMEAEKEKSTEIGETKDTIMEAENDHPKISQTNDPMMELPESDENVNLSTAVITQDVTFTNEAEQLRDINGELRKDGVDEDDCFTFTAVAKAFSNDSFEDDLVDTDEEDLGKDDAVKQNVRLVPRKSGTGIPSVGKQLIVHEECDDDASNLVDDTSVKSTALTKEIRRKPHIRKDLGTKITTRSDSRCIYEKEIWNDPVAEDLVDTEEEDSSEEDVYCATCQQKMTYELECEICDNALHTDCVFYISTKDGSEGKVCPQCAHNEPRTRLSMMDELIMATLHLEKSEYNETIHQNKDFPATVRDVFEINSFLCGIKYLKRNLDLKTYSGKDESGKERILPQGLVEEQFLYYYPDFKQKLMSHQRKDKWMEIPKSLMSYLVLQGKTFSDVNLFERLLSCESKEWQFIKYNTWNGQYIPSTKYGTYKVVDDETKRKLEDHAWISLTNDKVKIEVPVVPRLFISKWRKNCASIGIGNRNNELIELLKKAKDNCNNWVEIDAGASKSIHNRVEVGTPANYRVQPPGENSCIMTSLVNAFHYINDWEGRNKLLRKISVSIDYTKYSAWAKNRRSFAAWVMNHCVKGYECRLLQNVNILHGKTLWPTLCILQGTDGSINHAITTVENFIFESNCTHALTLNIDNLNWCCNTDMSSDVKFDRVPFAYRFVKHKPPPQLLLRGRNRNISAWNAMMQCMEYLKNEPIIQAMKEMSQSPSVTNINSNIFDTVRNVLHGKGVGYRPVRVHNIDEVMKRCPNSNPMMLLLNVVDTFIFEVICIVNSTIYYGTDRRPTLCTTMESLYSVFPGYSIETSNGIKVQKGYVFCHNSSSIRDVACKKKRRLYSGVKNEYVLM